MSRRTRWHWLICSLIVALFDAEPRLQSPSLDADLRAASGKGDVTAVTALLARGANVNAADRHGITALYVAADLGDVAIVKVLLQHGADPDVRDFEWGRTPLRVASVPGADAKTKAERAEVVRLLVAKGAGAAGESLGDLIRNGYVEAVRTIVGRGGVDPAYLNAALGAAKRAQQTQLIEALTKAGATESGSADAGPERIKRVSGIYRSSSGADVTLGPSTNYDDQIMLERRGRNRVALLSLDLLTFRSFDGQTLVALKAGPLPPASITLKEDGRSETFARTGDATGPGPDTAARTARGIRGADTARDPSSVARTKEWPSFRGPFSSGVVEGAHPPTTWDLEKGVNIKWKTAIPGLGHSSPIVWGDRIFVTTAVSSSSDDLRFVYGSGANSSASAANRSTTDDVKHSWRVYALEKQTGRILWERVAHEGVPRTARHVMESQANSTPATDGTHVVAWFGSEGLHCYDLNGNRKWRKDLGPLQSGNVVDPSYEWNLASSPIIYKNLVILQIDLLKKSFIVAFDLNSGAEVWRTNRGDEAPSWSTPLISESGVRTELVTLAPHFARGYDPTTGRELWRLGKHSVYATPTPIAGHGMIFITSGSGNTVQPIYAVRAGADGDITLGDDQTSSDWVVWSKHRGGAFMPTPLLYDDLLYVSSDTGVLAAYSVDTGERVYQERLTRGGNYAASGVAADGKLYFASEDGQVVVIKAGRTFERLAENEMGEVIMSTPAISDDMLVVRMQHHVVAVANSTQQR